MELKLSHQDALTELINIGYGRAASALSELTGHRVSLEVPRIAMHEINLIPPLVAEVVGNEVASVNQVFSGPIAGNAMLMMEEKSAVLLSRLLSDDESLFGSFDTSSREIITEIGNILLNACLGVFGNLLHVPVSFAVPRLQVSDVRTILSSISDESKELRYGLMIHTHFHLRTSNITGYLIIILGISSLDRMLQELEKWELRQTT